MNMQRSVDEIFALIKKKKNLHRHCTGPLRGSSSITVSQYNDGRFNLTASAFNQLSQYTSSPGRRSYCYAELAVFFHSGGRNHRLYSLRLPTEGWPG